MKPTRKTMKESSEWKEKKVLKDICFLKTKIITKLDFYKQ